jgi:hypothetical protein
MLIVIFGICGAVGALAPAGAAGGEPAPAKLAELSGPAAKELAALGYAQPVLVAYAGDGWTAVVFAESSAEIARLLDSLLIEDVPGCVREGAVACCENETRTFVVNTDRGWIRSGELCEPDTVDHEMYEVGVDLATISRSLSQQLFDCCGIDDDFIDMANRDGTARMLINSPAVTASQKAELSPLPMSRNPRPLRPSPASFVAIAEGRIILAHDHPTPPVACGDDVGNQCANNTRKKHCDPAKKHWYRKVALGGIVLWCHRVGCTCR